MSDLCERWKALLQDLVSTLDDDELARLPPEEASSIRAHVSSCKNCEEKALDVMFPTPPDSRTLELCEKLGMFMSTPHAADSSKEKLDKPCGNGDNDKPERTP